jgi:hypothetical protein
MATTQTQANNKPGLTETELAEIEKAVSEIRESTGWGRIEIVFQNGDMTDMEVNLKRKLKIKNPILTRLS